MVLQKLIETVPLSFWTKKEQVEIRIFENGEDFEVEHVSTKQIDGRMVIGVRKGERVT